MKYIFGHTSNRYLPCSLLVQAATIVMRSSKPMAVINSHCRVCGDPGHRSRDCPAIQSDDDLALPVQEAIEMDGISEASMQRKLRSPELRGAAAVPKTPPRRKGATSSAWLEVEETKPQVFRMDADTEIYLTEKEKETILKKREKTGRAEAKRIESKALTGIRADYPSLSHEWSAEVPFNVVGSVKSRMLAFMWKKVVWQLRMKQAVETTFPGARWKKNKKWLSMLFGKEVAAMWGHFGAMRQRLHAPVGVELM